MKIRKWEIEVFNDMRVEYGGHWRKLGDWTGLDALSFGFRKYFAIGYGKTYYDGDHEIIALGNFYISWSGRTWEYSHKQIGYWP